MRFPATSTAAAAIAAALITSTTAPPAFARHPPHFRTAKANAPRPVELVQAVELPPPVVEKAMPLAEGGLFPAAGGFGVASLAAFSVGRARKHFADGAAVEKRAAAAAAAATSDDEMTEAVDDEKSTLYIVTHVEHVEDALADADTLPQDNDAVSVAASGGAVAEQDTAASADDVKYAAALKKLERGMTLPAPGDVHTRGKTRGKRGMRKRARSSPPPPSDDDFGI